MIDTIRVKFLRLMSLEQLEGWDKYTHFKPDGSMTRRYVLNTRLDLGPPAGVLLGCELSVRATYLPVDYQGNPLLAVELSLPKAVFGNNFTMIRDLPEAIATANTHLTRIPRLPPVSLAEGILIRVDACYNHQVGTLVPDYISALGTLDFPHRRTKLHRNEGAEFRSKHTTTKFYDKFEESRHPDALGILRQETTLLKAKRIAQLFGKDQPTLADVTPEWAAELLRSDLERLKIHDRIIADPDTALAVLCKRHGSHAGMMYFGLIKARQTTSKHVLSFEADLPRRTLDRRLKAITDSGIACTLTEAPHPLPPLVIDL